MREDWQDSRRGQLVGKEERSDLTEKAIPDFVKELTEQNDRFTPRWQQGESESMAGERARLRSEVQHSAGSTEEGRPHQRPRLSVEPEVTETGRVQKKLPRRRPGHQPIRLMAGRPGFDFVASFRDAEVSGLTWGQFFDLSPEGKRQFVRLMVQERPRGSTTSKAKGKGKATARLVASALSEAALAGKAPPMRKVANFYTNARVRLNNRVMELSRVLIDAGSVVNLAPISILRSLGVPLHPTQDLVIRTAASNLVPLEYYTDLDVEVASVVMPIRIYAMPPSCQPTYGLLLSRGWLRMCQAIGDYANDSYQIKDQQGQSYQVLREIPPTGNESVPIPQVTINREVGSIDLGTDLQDDLELDESLPLSEIIRRISREAKEELAVLRALELGAGSSSDRERIGSELEEDDDEGGTDLYEESQSYASDEESFESEEGVSMLGGSQL
ncbi:hypothetical protein HOY82DRAFT_606765 [Tuber indicum]|nr:hypothetical protein HOY82DRAFT_606765 [Tuber indicum]